MRRTPSTPAATAGKPQRPAWHCPPDTHPILVVEDDDAMRAMLVTALSDAGYPVVAAAGGAQALDIVARQRPSVILLDLGMPGMDGAAFMAAYQALDLLEPRAPVIVCTAHPQPVIETKRIGAADFLRKPFILRELLTVAGAHASAVASTVDPSPG